MGTVPQFTLFTLCWDLPAVSGGGVGGGAELEDSILALWLRSKLNSAAVN